MNNETWMLSRRKFVTSILLGGVALQFPWLNSCNLNPLDKELPKNLVPLTLRSFLDLRSLLSILFPSDGNGPGAKEIKAAEYILWVLKDTNLDPNENQYIVKKLKLLAQLSFEQKSTEFHALSELDQDIIVQTAIKAGWGKRFFSRLLTLTFEALLIHPLYGGNTNELGWKWLEHNPGNPRATEKLSYPNLLNPSHEI